MEYSQSEITNKLISEGYIINCKIKKTENLIILINRAITNNLLIENCDFTEVENVYIQIVNSDRVLINIKDCKFQNLYFTHSKLKTINLYNFEGNRLIFEKIEVYKLYLYSITSKSICIKESDIKVLNFTEINTSNLICNYNEKISELKIVDSNIKKEIDIQNNKLIENLLINSLHLDDSKKTDILIWNNFITKDFHIYNVKINSLTLLENRISSNLIINTFKVKLLCFSDNIFEKNIIANMDYIKISEADSETYRVLKHFANKNSDNTNYLIFNKLEQNELIKEGKLSKADYIILFFKKNISDFGTNWARALVVTFIITYFIFYFPIFYFLKSNFIFCSIMTGEFWNGYLKFLNITDYSNPLKNDKTPITNGFINTWLFLGKIIMAVCIYEIIISFRKYHK